MGGKSLTAPMESDNKNSVVMLASAFGPLPVFSDGGGPHLETPKAALVCPTGTAVGRPSTVMQADQPQASTRGNNPVLVKTA